jgi:hypothetical protein
MAKIFSDLLSALKGEGSPHLFGITSLICGADRNPHTTLFMLLPIPNPLLRGKLQFESYS